MRSFTTIPNFPKYEINRRGDIRRIGKNKLLSNSIEHKNSTSYARVTLFIKGQRYYLRVHRLVGIVFIPNPANLPEIDHKDTNGLNNHVSNLEWVTSQENIIRAFKNNPIEKTAICSLGGKAGALVMQTKATIKYKHILGHRFVKFYPGGQLIPAAAITYLCTCGVKRTASVMWKELRKHNGKCPACTNTINRSSESLL